MKLSEQLLQSNNSGDCGNYFEGYAERATLLEAKLKLAVDAFTAYANDYMVDQADALDAAEGLSCCRLDQHLKAKACFEALATIKEMDKR